MCLPPRVIPRPYTDLAFQGWCFAGERDRGESFYIAVFQAYFVDERDIGDLSVLTELAENCGLSGQDFRAALVAGTYTETVRRPPTCPGICWVFTWCLPFYQEKNDWKALFRT